MPSSGGHEAERKDFEVAIVGLGGIGSGAAYWASKRAGAGVLGLERFELGHERGASQDHSRIIRLSYHAPEYVRFAFDAYAAWEEVERDSGQRLVVRTGGIDLFPADAPEALEDYAAALDANGVRSEALDPAETMRRWPQWRIGDDVRVLYQEASGLVAAAKANAAHRRLAVSAGATLLDHARVSDVRETGGTYELETDAGTFRAERLIVAADAWTNDLLRTLWRPINLTVTQEQVTYYDAADPRPFEPDRFPIWIWMGDPSFYGLPSYDGTGPKIGWDVGGPEVTGDTRSFEPSSGYSETMDAFVRDHLPEAFGPYRERKTCLYTLTPDRDFVLDVIPGHDRAAVGLGSAHGFKFASAFGRALVDLVFDGEARSDVGAWSLARDVLTMADPPKAFHV